MIFFLKFLKVFLVANYLEVTTRKFALFGFCCAVRTLINNLVSDKFFTAVNANIFKFHC